MPAGGGDLQRALGVMLAAHIAQIPFQDGFRRRRLSDDGRLQGVSGRQLPANFQKMRCAQHARAADQHRFVGIVARHQQGSLGVSTGEGGRQHASNAPQIPAQRKFAEKLVLL